MAPPKPAREEGSIVVSMTDGVDTNAPSVDGRPARSPQPTRTASRDASTTPSTTTTGAAAPDATSSTNASKPKRARAKSQRRREQCRKNQERYRNKQNTAAVDLEITVQRLRLQVLQLEDRRRTLYRAINTRESALQLIIEYFRLFRSGLSSGCQLPLIRGQPVEDIQLAFLRSNFHHDVRVESTHGLASYIEMSRRFTTLYDNLHIELLRCQEVCATEVSTSLLITQRLLLTVSQTTIRQVFPHLQRPENDRIKWKLLGRQIEFTVCGTFHINESGTVVELDWSMNFARALEQVLSVEEVAVVLQLAQIVRDGYAVESGRAEEEVCDWSDGDMIDQHEMDGAFEETDWRGTEGVDRYGMEDEVREEDGYDDDDGEEEDDEGGYLIHDGKGDDFVMV